MTQAGCRLLTLHDMPILRLHFTCVFRVSHGSRTCGMLRTAGSEVLGKDLSFVHGSGASGQPGASRHVGFSTFRVLCSGAIGRVSSEQFR